MTEPARDLPQLAVPCPTCQAVPGALCTSHGGTRPRRNDVHQTRSAAWAEADRAAKPRACWCADPGRTEDEMYQCPAGDADEECLAHDYLAVDGPFGYGLGGRLPIPDLTDLRDAVVAAEVEQERSPMTSPAYPEPGSEIPDQPGYVVATCRHRVAASEWRAGFRTCERCPATQETTEVPK